MRPPAPTKERSRERIERIGADDAPAADNSQAIVDLKALLEQKSEESDRLGRELELMQRRVMELERERELQNQSLRVLHQQLELEKERGQRAAAG